MWWLRCFTDGHGPSEPIRCVDQQTGHGPRGQLVHGLPPVQRSYANDDIIAIRWEYDMLSGDKKREGDVMAMVNAPRGPPPGPGKKLVI